MPVRCNLYRFNEETLREPELPYEFSKISLTNGHVALEFPRPSSFEIQDTRPSPFTRGFLSFRANFFSSNFPSYKWKSIPPRVLFFFCKKNLTGKLKKKENRFASKLLFQSFQHFFKAYLVIEKQLYIHKEAKVYQYSF